ncbi:MAG: hypothetical protein H6551_01230 [Chitinophagales bacterium]|nr:hypothetical protein [Chitinophagaceae bacterium]MCB9063747.1 hypothetical protein [Chitinophagales bacterium]
MKRFIVVLTILLSITLSYNNVSAQGHLSGDLMMNVNFFNRDTAINASDNPLYDNVLSGGEGWLNLRYYNKGFTATVRVDAFHNSNRYNPIQTLNGYGLGAWSLSKDIDDLSITAGYIYDQIGSGILFRAYEDRGLLIDNALVGIRLKYQLTDNISFKGFTGQQKFLYERYKPIIKGANVEGSFSIGDNIFLTPGIGALNRTFDQDNMDEMVSSINSQPLATRFVPVYNMYSFTAYNNLTIGGVNWYIEGCYKTDDNIIGQSGLLELRPGNVVFTTLGYARKGFAVNFTGKRTENFEMRTSPNEVLIRGLMNWQPIVARLRPQRLMARYTPATLNLSEIAGGGDVLIAPNEDLSITLNYTHINTLQDVKLYREGYFEVDYRGWESIKLNAGIQYMEYNQELYQVKPLVPIIVAYTPFFEVTYLFNSKTSIRTEWEYQATQQDFGSWIFGLVELNIAPKWSFAVSDMYNFDPGPAATTGSQHYYNIFVAHTKGPHRFTASYAKQVEGINCTGGVCRYEPAFSGFRLGLTTSF